MITIITVFIKLVMWRIIVFNSNRLMVTFITFTITINSINKKPHISFLSIS